MWWVMSQKSFQLSFLWLITEVALPWKWLPHKILFTSRLIISFAPSYSVLSSKFFPSSFEWQTAQISTLYSQFFAMKIRFGLETMRQTLVGHKFQHTRFQAALTCWSLIVIRIPRRGFCVPFFFLLNFPTLKTKNRKNGEKGSV